MAKTTKPPVTPPKEVPKVTPAEVTKIIREIDKRDSESLRPK